MIEWTKIDQPRFDRIVETLLLRKYHGAGKVVAVDGRGGDGGIDVEVTHADNTVTIYQLKYFPEGMSGGWQPRRTQVRKSFRKVVKNHDLDTWVLVVPRNLSPGERTFVEVTLPAAVDTPPAIEVLDRSGLDALLVDYPDVDRWLTRDHLREAAKDFNHERALLLGGLPDLTDRVRDLAKVVDSTDDNWTVDFARQGRSSIYTLRALHDNAAERSPITINFGGRIDPKDQEFANRLDTALKYGSTTPVTIPGKYIDSFDVTGPAFLAGSYDAQQVTMHSNPLDVPASGKVVEVEFFDEAEALIASHEGKFTKIVGGNSGFTNEVTFYSGHFRLEFMLAGHPGTDLAPPDVKLTYNLSDTRPSEVREIIELKNLFKTAARVLFTIEGQPLTAFRTEPGGAKREVDEDDAVIAAFAADLEVVFGHLRRRHMFPTSFSEEDRVNARAARLIIEDRIVASPQARSFRCQLSGDADTSDEVLRHTLQDEVYIRWPAESYPFTIGHRDFDLGLVWILHPRAHAVNGAAAVAAIEAGCADGFEVQFTPGDDPFFYVASLDPDAATRAADNRTFTAWGLPGIDEPWLDRPWFNGGQAV